jgi:iron complex transport system substrate-binding protein
VLSLELETLDQVVDTFVTVAEACGVGERGRELVGRFWEDAGRILRAVDAKAKTADDPHESPAGREESRKRGRGRPRILFLEWLDPPYDAGHWIPDMIAPAPPGRGVF